MGRPCHAEVILALTSSTDYEELVYKPLVGANLHTHCVDDWAGRLKQKSFGTILPSLLHIQTANCQLDFLIHRNSRQLLRVSVFPW